MAQQKLIRRCIKRRAEAREGVRINLFVSVSTDSLNRVSGETCFRDKVLHRPLSTEALVLNVAAVVGQHLDFDGRLGGTRHRKGGETRHIMQP